MAVFNINRINKKYQYPLSVLAVIIISSACFVFSSILGYREVAYILLITVSLIAMVFDIWPVLIAAVLSALIWNFFFIPPHFTFHVSSAEDSFLLAMYLIIAMVNGVLTHKIRRMEKAAILKEEKENTVKLYNTLLSSLSHELRTPIATIIGATDNLLANNSNLTALNRHDLVAEIAKASFRLNQQVENLLNMSRLEAGFIQPKNDWTDINELVYGVVKIIEENKITQKISININPGLPLFKLDKGLLEQVIYNLLNNAAQYTPADSLIDIVAVAYPNELQIIISDNGNGFPDDERLKVFDKFYRLKQSKAGGTGLGLSIVKGFTEAMKGKVWLENIDSGGAKFTISIPAPSSYLKTVTHE